MALLVVVLLTGMILIVMVSISASMSMGARQGGVDERAAYQALNSAESGLNTFKVRVQERLKTNPLPDRNNLTWAKMTEWLQPLSTYEDATLGYINQEPVSGGFKFDLEATGKRSGATKKVLQGFVLSMGALDFDFRPRAALTSLPAINANGNADVTGTANTGKVAEVAGLTTSLTPTFNLPVDDASGLRVGDYFKIGSTTYRVNTVQDNATGSDMLNVTALNVSSPTNISVSLGSDLILSLNAVAAQYNTGSDPMTIKLSNAGDFVHGETVTIDGLKAKVTITEQNEKDQTVTLDWVSSFPATLGEGTTIFRDIAAMRSAEGIDPKDNKLDQYDMSPAAGTGKVADCPTPTTCKGAEDKVLEEAMKSGQAFFTEMILGLTDAELDEAVPLSNSLIPMKDEVRRIPAANFDEVIKNGNSSGILIVDGDINSNINGNTTFNGFIYFRGNQGGKFNGNLTVNGAIAVRGGPIEGLTKDDVATDITGSLDLNYDAVGLRKQMLNSFGVPTIQAQKNTWRQQ